MKAFWRWKFGLVFLGPLIGRESQEVVHNYISSGTQASWHACCWLHREVWPATAALYDHLLFFPSLAKHNVDNDEQLCYDNTSTQTHKRSQTQVGILWMDPNLWMESIDFYYYVFFYYYYFDWCQNTFGSVYTPGKCSVVPLPEDNYSFSQGGTMLWWRWRPHSAILCSSSSRWEKQLATLEYPHLARFQYDQHWCCLLLA